MNGTTNGTLKVNDIWEREKTKKKIHTLAKNAETNKRLYYAYCIWILNAYNSHWTRSVITIEFEDKSEIKCTQTSWQRSILFNRHHFSQMADASIKTEKRFDIGSGRVCIFTYLHITLYGTGHLELKVFHAFWHFHIFLNVSFFQSFRVLILFFICPSPNIQLHVNVQCALRGLLVLVFELEWSQKRKQSFRAIYYIERIRHFHCIEGVSRWKCPVFLCALVWLKCACVPFHLFCYSFLNRVGDE